MNACSRSSCWDSEEIDFGEATREAIHGAIRGVTHSECRNDSTMVSVRCARLGDCYAELLWVAKRSRRAAGGAGAGGAGWRQSSDHVVLELPVSQVHLRLTASQQVPHRRKRRG
jgi:hypothetical protein